VRAVRALMGRIEIELGPDASKEAVGDRIRRTFGIANFSYATRSRLDLDAWPPTSCAIWKGRRAAASGCRRAARTSGSR
jgi:hypothetical protein